MTRNYDRHFLGFFFNPRTGYIGRSAPLCCQWVYPTKTQMVKGRHVSLIHKMMIPTRKQPPADYLGATTTKEISPTQSLFNELISRLAPPPFDLNYTMLFRRKA
jgi:hypothetical protein